MGSNAIGADRGALTGVALVSNCYTGHTTHAQLAALPTCKYTIALFPAVSHTLYDFYACSTTAGGYGPPNWDKTPDYVTRIVNIANAMAWRTNFQFFVNEVRYKPDR